MYWIVLAYAAIGMFIAIGVVSEQRWRVTDDFPNMNNSQLSWFTLICGCVFCGLIWPIVLFVKLLTFFVTIINF